jgi:histidyl-tRNA synthetase
LPISQCLISTNVADIPFEWDQQLVRGLDYYSQTCWEFIEAVPAATAAAKKLGQSQSAVLAGGRYDGLAETMGAKAAAPSIGYCIVFGIVYITWS